MNFSLCTDAVSKARSLQFDEATKSLVYTGPRKRVVWADLLGDIVLPGALLHKVELGDVVLTYGATGFDLTLKGDPSGKSGKVWRTRCTAFAGKAALSVGKTRFTNEWVINFSSARFAGTQVPADFEARLHVNQEGVCELSVKFLWGGFGASVKAAKWLAGAADLTGDSLHAASLVSCGTFAGVRGNPDKLVTVKFHPAWVFECAGAFVFESGGRTQGLDGLVVALATSKMIVRSSAGWRRRSVVLLKRSGGLHLRGIEVSCPEGRLVGLSDFGFPLLSLSFAEEDRGGKECVLVALPGPLSDRLSNVSHPPVWAFGKGLTAHDGSPWSVVLNSPCLVAQLAGDGLVKELHVQATLGNAETWAHAGLASLLVRAPLLPGFQYSKIGDKTWFGHPSQLGKHSGLDFRLGSLVVRAGTELVTDPVPAASGTVVRLGAAAPGSQALLPRLTELHLSWEGLASCVLRAPAGQVLGYSRPADLLNLQFRLRDFGIQGGPGIGYQLLRLRGSGCLEVLFPPQSICEESRNEKLPTVLGSILDPALPPPKHLMAAQSVLAFSSDKEVLSLDETTLFAWLDTPEPSASALWTPVVSEAARRGVKSENPSWQAGTTGIELPYGLIISGNENARWRGVKGGPVAEGRRELWHVSEYMRTALGGLIAVPTGIVSMIGAAGSASIGTVGPLGAGDAIGDLSSIDLGNLLAALGPDDSVPMKALEAPDKPAFQNPLKKFMGLEPRVGIVDNSNKLHPFYAHQLILSPLGAWLNAEGNWNSVFEQWKHRATLGRDHFVKIVLRGHLLPFGHRAVLVRTSERKIASSRNGVKEAILFDRYFIIVRQPERLFSDPEGIKGSLSSDALAYRRMMPFQKVELLTKETGLLEAPPDEANKSRASAKFWPRPLGHSKEFWQFKLRGTDRTGKTSTWHMPLLFVLGQDETMDLKAKPPLIPESQQDFFKRVAKQAVAEGLGYDREALAFEKAEVSWKDAKWITHLKDQSVTLADGITASHPVRVKGAVEVKTTQFEPVVMGFGDTLFKCWVAKEKVAGDGRVEADNPFLPVLMMAEMSTPSLKTFHATTSLALRFADVYLSQGLSAGGNPQDVLLQHDDFKTKGFSTTPLSKEATGGVAAPLPRIAGFSRRLGVVGGSSVGNAPLDAVALGQFHPADYFEGTPATLLGGLRFDKILAPITADMNTAVASMPQWRKRVEGAAEILFLNWETTSFLSEDEQDSKLFVKFVPKGTARLSLSVEHRTADGKDEVITRGTVSNFGISFAGMLRLDFNAFSFESRGGGKPEVHVDLDKDNALHFTGQLSFVDKLSKALDLKNFMDPPYLDIDSEGLTCGYNIRIPSIAVGVFALQNISLDARICLPFVSKPLSVRFALCERHNPFLLTISLFTGGGFFAIEIDAAGNRFIEASLEAGGSLSVDLGLAKGNAYVMLGIYFSISTESGTVVVGGYFRMGGSLVVLGIITVSTEFYLQLNYVSSGSGASRVEGEGRLSLSVKIAFFSVSVELSVKREFEGGSEDLPFEALMSEDALELYFGAFDQQEANT